MIGFWTRVAYAFRCFYWILFRGAIPPDIVRKLAAKAAQAGPTAGATQSAVAVGVQQAPISDSPDRAVQILALLQRDGRLIDFLTEDVAPYPDAQLGAAVRSIHENCRQVLERYLKLEPVLASEEDQPVTIQAGFDPASIKLIGNVSGQPPVRGVLRHRGWQVKELTLPSLPGGSGRSVIAPAEVEVA